MKITRSKVAGLTVNLMDSCDQCTYCWNNALNERFHPDSVGNLQVDHNIEEFLEQLDRGIPTPYPENEVQFCQREYWDIQLSAKCEFFHEQALATVPGRDYSPVKFVLTQFLINRDLGRRVRILSKRNYAGFLPLIPHRALCGVSITTLDEKQSTEYQPGAATPNDLISCLHQLNTAGRFTWCVVEPFFTGMNLLELVKQVPFLLQLWVGRLNGKGRDGYDVPTDEEIIVQFDEARRWARKYAPQMNIMLKKELIGKLRAGRTER